MTTINETPPKITPETTTWEVELQKVGLVRRILNARRWYGADWWFVAISSVLVVIFIIIALFPKLFARRLSTCSIVGGSNHLVNQYA
jgi:hypothetical protein